MTQTPIYAQGFQREAPTMTQPRYVITDADRQRQKQIEQAWKAYHGEFEKPLQPMPGAPDDNVMTNRCQAIVDRGVDFLFGKELEISVEEGAPDEAQALLDATWGRKETRIPLLQDLAMNGACAGRAFLRIVPAQDGTRFRLVVVDPSIVFVETAPQDCETVLLYCIEYCTHEQVNGSPQKTYYREEIARVDPDGNARRMMPDKDDTWSIQHWTRVGDRGEWQAAGDPIAWPYPFPPLFSCKNLPRPNSFWGTADLTSDLIGVNNALNLVQSNINRVQKLYGQPILYATGTGEQVIDIKPGRIIGLPTVESKIEAVSIASDVANALQFAANLRSDIDEQSAVPGVATGRIADLPRGNMSGIAIELMFMPLVKKTDKKRCLYGELLIDVSCALLVLAGFSTQIQVALAWQSALPSDDLPSVQSAIAKKELGISNTTLQRELGYDPEEEMELSKTEDAQALENFARGQGLPPAVPGTRALPGQQPEQGQSSMQQGGGQP